LKFINQETTKIAKHNAFEMTTMIAP